MSNLKQLDKFTEERQKLVTSVMEEFVGPSADYEFITENPVTRYAAGMLFPNHYESRRDEPASASEVLDTENGQVNTDDVEVENPESGSANTFFPSVTGLSFYALNSTSGLKVNINWTTYRKLEIEEIFIEISEEIPELITSQPEFNDNFEFKDGKLYVKRSLDYSLAKAITEKTDDKKIQNIIYKAVTLSQGTWKSETHNEELNLGEDFKSKVIAEGLELICQQKKGKDKSLFTLALKNTHPACAKSMDEDHVFFNVKLIVTSGGQNSAIFIEYPSQPLFHNDEEEKSLELLYRNRKTFAVGHGCAVNWTYSKNYINADSVYTETLPTFEIPQMDFDIPGINDDILSMLVLSGESTLNKDSIIIELKKFAKLYKDWINNLQKQNIPPHLSDTALKHIENCNETYLRIMKGIEILEHDSIAYQAFCLANRSMLMQSLHSNLQKQKRTVGNDDIVWPDYKSDVASTRRWRPFQLGFILLSINGITNTSSVDRSLVDLVWFPTGGGKTEAYLGLSSFSIFYRRLKYLGNHSGTVVIMRYTLRLLTAQQFQRACTLICAMEKIRQENISLLGEDEISIGLWVGIDSTPNMLDQAEKDFQEYIFGNSNKNPSPLLSCPWCGTKMVEEYQSGQRKYGYKRKLRPKQANLFCLEPKCSFNQRLPVLIVDEEIYRDPPTLLFGTVDKFAQMPLQRGIAKVFAADTENKNRPPELIVQDELHLISGALGTLVGIYETAVDYLCSKKGISPKIIASTATVRRAAEQCKNLFNRTMKQFPPSGLDIKDSFFAKEKTLDDPGRLYIGLMPSGKTQTTAAVRLAAKLIYAVFSESADDFVKDKYWTLVSYFNSIRELGGFISLANDDIPLYANALRQRYGGMMRHISILKELTSRKRAEEIPQILDQLSIEYPDRSAIDILAATNMISVGVDIDRLGLMIIRGQPKLTAEYIQVSSRIGRKFPGLVITLYNSARTRDRSHYERFRTYHESFYRNVEPSSVTPFSAPSRARALSAVLITMFRHGFDNVYGDESGASLFDPKFKGINELKEFIKQRVGDIDDDEKEGTLVDFDKLISEWNIFNIEHDKKLVYKSEQHGTPLAKPNNDFGKGLWSLPTSMRNVDAECNIEVVDD